MRRPLTFRPGGVPSITSSPHLAGGMRTWPLNRRDDHLIRLDGRALAILECADLDVTALDFDRQATAVAGVERLCRTLREPVQLLVQLRRRHAEELTLPPTRATGEPREWPQCGDLRSPAGHALRTAEEAHTRTLLDADPAFARRVLAICSAAAPGPALERTVESVRSALAGAGVETLRLDGNAATALLHESWGSTASNSAEGPIAPPPWSESPTHLRSGSLLLRGVRLRRLPGTPVEPGWLAPLLRVRVECDIAIHLHPAGVAGAMARLDRRLRHLRADQLAQLDRERVEDAAVDAGADAALDLRDRLARNLAHPVWLSITAVARATDLAGLDTATHALRGGFSATLAGDEAAHFEHLDAAVSTWPLADDRSPRRKLTDSAAAATCIPLVQTVCNDPDGYLLGRTLADDTPVRLAPFDTVRHANANIAVLASSGRGKSYALGTVVLSAAARGVGSIIVDPEGEHCAMVRALGGDVLELRPGCGSALNIFECGAVGSEGDAPDAEIPGAVVALVDVLLGGLDEVERACIDSAAQQAIRAAQATGRVPVLGDCVEPLRGPVPRVATVLHRFCSGALGELFSRPTSIRLDAPVVGISLRDLRDELVPAATLIVAEWLWALVRRDRRRRHLVFDEVGLLCAHQPLRTLLAQLARRCRKYQASLVIATQNAGDLLSSEEGRVMATNPAIVLLGGHRGAETQRMEQTYALTPRQRSALEGAARGEFLLLAGQRRLPIRIEAPPLHHAVLTGVPVQIGVAAPDGRPDPSRTTTPG